MLKIYRYLATASAVLLFLALMLIVWFYNQQATRDLVDMAAKHSIAVDRMLSNTIWSHYQDHFAAAENMSRDALRSHPETAEINDLITKITEGVQILKVKIYSTDGLIIYSTNPSDIGGDYTHSEAFTAAAQEGRLSSSLSYRDRFSAFSGEVFNRDVVETYLPKFDDAGNVLGVVELYADVTEVKEQIDGTTIRILIFLTVIFGLMYAVLVVGIMRRGIEPIEIASKRAAEIGPRMPGIRLPIDDMPKEVRPLILAINAALERLDRALDAQRRFAADAAHEVLTPLALLRTRIDTMDGSAGDANPIARRLRDDVDMMSDMVHQLLDLAELESHGSATGEAEQADLHGVALEVVSMLAPLAVRDGKELALSGATGPIPVKGCSKMLNRALRNLIENALGHTPENTTVEVNLGAEGLIRVMDQGEGVPVERRDAVFQRFWRGDNRSGPGAGLGLSIVRRIVESMDGRIWIEDAPGGGACFAVQLVTASTTADAGSLKDAGSAGNGDHAPIQ
jgi:signal transduction histidine kinase